MRRIFAMILMVFTMFNISCKSEKKEYEDKFDKNYLELLSLKSNLYKRLDERMKIDSSKIVVVFTSDPVERNFRNYVYDQAISDKMKRLDIQLIRCQTIDVKKCGAFGTINFLLNAKEYPTDKAVYFIYTKCDDFKDYQKKRYYLQYRLKKNWGLLIDRT